MRNKWFKRMLAVSMAAVMTAGMVTGCGGGDTSSKDDGTEKTKAAETGGEFDWKNTMALPLRFRWLQHTASEAMVNKLERV